MVSIDVSKVDQLAKLPAPLGDLGLVLNQIQSVMKNPVFTQRLSHELAALHMRDPDDFKRYQIDLKKAQAYFENDLPQRLSSCSTEIEIAKDGQSYAVHGYYKADSHLNTVPGVDLKSGKKSAGIKRDLSDLQDKLKAVQYESSIINQFLINDIDRLDLKEKAMDARIELALKMFPFQSPEPHHNSSIYLLNLYDALTAHERRPDMFKACMTSDKRPQAQNALRAYRFLQHDLKPLQMRMISGEFDIPQGPFQREGI